MKNIYPRLPFLFLFLAISSFTALAQTKIITTIAGNDTAGYSGDGGRALAAEFGYMDGIATDRLGNVYVVDETNNAIRKINSAGIITTFLGGLHGPSGVAVDTAENVYISESSLNFILKVSPAGIATIVAGGGSSAGLSGDGHAATSAALSDPQGIAVDAMGNLYIADMVNSAVRKVVAATGIIYTIAGTGASAFSGDGPATATELYWPQGVAVDGSGNVYLSDLTQRVREVVAATGFMRTIAGNETALSFAGYGGPATSEGINPYGIAIDDSGNVFIADVRNNRIRKVDTSGVITTIAGDGTGGYIGLGGSGGGVGGYSGDGGPADSSELYGPNAIAFDANGNLLIADAGNYVVRKIIPPTGVFFAGGAAQSLSVCANTVASINSVLAVTDTVTGETIGWSAVTAPLHGVLVAAYTTSSTGATVTPVGITYTPTLYYTGTDSFIVKATNGGITVYIRIRVTVNAAPLVGFASGYYTTICNGSSTEIIAIGSGTPGGGDTVVKQDFNTSIAPWTVDTTGTTGATDGAGWIDAPNDFFNAMGFYYNPDSTAFGLANAYGTGAPSTTKSRLISPSFSTVGYTDAALYFDMSYKNNTDTSAEVDISTDGGVTWTTLVNYSLTTPTDLLSGILPFVPKTISLSAYAGYPDVKLRFYYNSHRGWYWAVDNIAIVGYPTGIDAATWAPVTNLFTNTGHTAPYTAGAYRDTVYVHPTTVAATTNFTYYATEAIGSCSVTDSITITVTPAVPILGREAVCVGAHDTLTSAAPFGSWVATNADVYIGFTTGIITGLAAGVDTIQYTTTGSCAGTAVVTVTVSAAVPAIAAITGAATVCAGATVSLSDITTGGAWSSGSTTIATVNSAGMVTGIGAGSAIMSYSVANGCGAAIATAPVTVNPLPVAGTITGAAATCAGATVSLGDTATGGAWSCGSTSIATVNSAGVVTGIATGSAIMSYSVANGCGTAVAFAPVTVNPLPVAGTITGAATVCAGATVSLGDITTGGAWSSGATGIATVGSTGRTTGITVGSAIISYSVTNSCGTAIAIQPVTVNSLPVAGTITGIAALCSGATILLGDAITGGVWSSSASGIATISAAAVVTGVTAGASLISYTVTNGCGTAFDTVTIVVGALPYAGTITGPANVCAGATALLIDTSGSGIWSSSNTTAAVSGGAISTTLAGTDTISYAVTNSCGTAIATQSITINPLPVAAPVTGRDSICEGDITTLSDITGGGAWSSGNAVVASIGSSGIATGVSIGATDITYTVTDSCGTATAVFHITVHACVTGITAINHSGMDAVIIYPNPAGNELTIKTQQDAYNTLTVTNTTGQQLIQQKISATATTVSLQPLPPGIYYITLAGDSGTKTDKFVKE